MKIWIAVVEHRHGQNVYAAKTKKKLVDQLYEYVKQWWESEIPDEELPACLRADLPAPRRARQAGTHRQAKASRREIVDRYFERVSHEWLETLSQVTVE